MTLDFLYLSDGWQRNSSENRVNNINMLEVYHEIRLNLKFSRSCFYARCQVPNAKALFGLSHYCQAPIKQHCLIGMAQIAQLVAVYPQVSCGRFSSNTLTVREEMGLLCLCPPPGAACLPASSPAVAPYWCSSAPTARVSHLQPPPDALQE